MRVSACQWQAARAACGMEVFAGMNIFARGRKATSPLAMLATRSAFEFDVGGTRGFPTSPTKETREERRVAFPRV